jgi:hypothetical protein
MCSPLISIQAIIVPKNAISADVFENFRNLPKPVLLDMSNYTAVQDTVGLFCLTLVAWSTEGRFAFNGNLIVRCVLQKA